MRPSDPWWGEPLGLLLLVLLGVLLAGGWAFARAVRDTRRERRRRRTVVRGYDVQAERRRRVERLVAESRERDRRAS
jgi:hypothetical protein